MPAAMLAALASRVLRVRHSQGEERQQLKWLVYAGALLAVVAMPVAAGVAIVRYRLYDIDRLINRTLVYASLTAVLGLGYAASVLVMSQLFGRDRSSFAVAGATLPWRRCSSRCVAASNSARRSISTRCRRSCWRWSTRRCSQPECRFGFDRRRRLRKPSLRWGEDLRPADSGPGLG